MSYSSPTVQQQCTSVKAAKKLLGGDMRLTMGLLSRIQALEGADTVKDIVAQPSFHFHKLYNKRGDKLEGFFAIDVKTRKDPWRLIFRPLDNEGKPYVPCDIDKIAGEAKAVEVREVSKHYE